MMSDKTQSWDRGPNLERLKELVTEYESFYQRRYVVEAIVDMWPAIITYIADLECALRDAFEVGEYAIVHVSDYLRKKHDLDRKLKAAQQVHEEINHDRA